MMETSPPSALEDIETYRFGDRKPGRGKTMSVLTGIANGGMIGTRGVETSYNSGPVPSARLFYARIYGGRARNTTPERGITPPDCYRFRTSRRHAAVESRMPGARNAITGHKTMFTHTILVPNALTPFTEETKEALLLDLSGLGALTSALVRDIDGPVAPALEHLSDIILAIEKAVEAFGVVSPKEPI